MGIDIGSLSSVTPGGVPPNPANFIQRVGRAGRRDGNAAVFAIADASPDGTIKYYFANPLEMLKGDVEARAIDPNAAEVLRRQLYAFFFDHWVAEESPALPDKLERGPQPGSRSWTAIPGAFPSTTWISSTAKEPALFEAFCRMLGDELRPETRAKLQASITGTEQQKNLRARFLALSEETHAERESWKKRRKAIDAEVARAEEVPRHQQTLAEIDLLERSVPDWGSASPSSTTNTCWRP